MKLLVILFILKLYARVKILKFGIVTKLDKKNKTTSKKFGDDVRSRNCEVIAIFPIYSQFGAIRKLDSGRVVYRNYVFINRNFLSYKNRKQN